MMTTVNKKNLIFLHGFPFNSASWAPQVEHFKNKFNVLAPDLRGHGNGPNGSGPWMIAHFAADLKALLDASKIDKAVICGLSMGGYIALHFAQQYPERIAGLVLCDTQADADSNEAKDKRYAMVEKIRQEGLSSFSEDFSKAVVCENTLKENPAVQKQLASMITANKAENIAMTLGALASRRDSNVYLPTFKFPTLIMVGAEDKITPLALSQKLVDGIPNSKLQVIERSGHLSNLEQPAIFNQHLENFLSSTNL